MPGGIYVSVRACHQLVHGWKNKGRDKKTGKRKARRRRDSRGRMVRWELLLYGFSMGQTDLLLMVRSFTFSELRCFAQPFCFFFPYGWTSGKKENRILKYFGVLVAEQ